MDKVIRFDIDATFEMENESREEWEDKVIEALESVGAKFISFTAEVSNE